MASIPIIDADDRGGPDDLLTHGLGWLVDLSAVAPLPFAPLVIVAADRTPASTWLARLLEANPAAAAVDRIAFWDGPTLGRAVAARGVLPLHAELARHRVVVIDHVDTIGDPERQHAAAGLFDALHAAGIATCVSLARHPAVDGSLQPQLASRLLGGLLVVVREAAIPPTGADAPHPRRSANLGRIFAAVARHQECSVADLCGPSRCRRIAAARSLAIHVARVVTGKSFHAIAAACGGRDHTTAIHAMKVVTRRMARDAAFAGDVRRLVQRLASPLPMATERSFAVDSGEDCPLRPNRRGPRRPPERRPAPNRRRSAAG